MYPTGAYVQEWNTSSASPRASAPKIISLPKLDYSTHSPSSQPSSAGGDYYEEEVAHGALHWAHREVPIFIEGGGIGFRSSYYTDLEDSLKEWTRASGGLVQFVETHYPHEAAVTVDWVPNSPQSGESGNTTITYRTLGGERLLNHAHIDLAALINGRQLSDVEMKKACLHELGHALGLVHATSPADIMYFRSNPAQGTSLSARDSNTIRRLYFASKET
jgi:hypothetical protein